MLRRNLVLCMALLAALALGGFGVAGNAVSESPNNAMRYDKLGHQMICICSCAQILAECNHVGCPNSPGMLAMLQASLDKGDGDRTILESFQAKYGPTVLAAPMFTRFNNIAWIMPPAVLLLGMLGAILLIRKWRLAHIEPEPVPVTIAATEARNRIRRETEF